MCRYHVLLYKMDAGGLLFLTVLDQLENAQINF